VKRRDLLPWSMLVVLFVVALAMVVGGCSAPHEVILAGSAVTVEARALSADVLAMYPDANMRPAFAGRALTSAERIRTLQVPVNAYLRGVRPDSNTR